MKINGQEVKKISDVIYGPETIDRGSDGVFAFFGRAIGDFKEFEKLCPTPTPPVKAFDRKGQKTFDEKDPQYKQDLETHDRRYHGYYILKTLEPTNLDLSEHGITLTNCEGWENVHEVLNEELGHFEFARLIRFVDACNSLDPDKMEANLETFFLQSAQQDAGSSSNDQNGEPENTNSGELAKDGA